MRVHSGVIAKKALRHSLLPEVFPRVGSLFFSGFGTIPFLLALLCVRVRLLHKGHPFFHSGAKFGIRHVLAESARNLQFSWKNIDQIIVFAAIVCGAATTLAFFLALIFYALFFQTAFASGWVPGIFETAQPHHDLAFMMLDRVFGIPGIFDSAIITDTLTYGPAPNPFQTAMHELFRFFSWGLFSLAIFIFLYFVIEIVWDLTQSGAPLGETLSNTWIPIRLIVAFGLLLPMANGLNSAQYITLYSAKFGSGVATNAWGYFNQATGENPLGLPNEHLVADIKMQDLSGLLKNLMLMKACHFVNNGMANLALHGQGLPTNGDGQYGVYEVQPYIINGSNHKPLFGYGSSPPPSFLGASSNQYNATPSGVYGTGGSDPFQEILTFSDVSNIRMVLGYVNPADPKLYSNYPGGVLPVCGEISIPVTGYGGEQIFAAEAYFYSTLYVLFNQPRGSYTLSTFEENSSLAVVREYTRNSAMFTAAMKSMKAQGLSQSDCSPYDTDGDHYESVNEGNDPGKNMGLCTEAIPADYWTSYLTTINFIVSQYPIAAARNFLIDQSASPSAQYIGDTSYSALSVPNPLMLTTGVVELGWGGAGIWYNRISEKNGSLIAAVGATPSIIKMPLVMEKIKAEGAKNNAGTGKGHCDQYSPEQAGTTAANISDERAQFTAEFTQTLYGFCRSLFENEHILVSVNTGNPTDPQSGNSIKKAMGSVFGQSDLFNIGAQDGILPMAQLSSVGRLLIDKSIMAFLGAVGASAAGGAMHLAAASPDGKDIAALNLMGDAFGQASSAAMGFATLGLTAGVVLHYVLPFLPFMYFFFAVGRWVKTIFEAMVGVPLWALAHLRLSGPGLPGEAASSGYFLLLEIFVRPVLTVLSLVGSFAVFTALVTVMNGIFALLITNFGGADLTGATGDAVDTMRGIADQFFYSLMYVVLSYMIATASFKMIDIIPDNIIRWSGAGVSSMGASDNADELIDQLQSQLPIMINYYSKQMASVASDVLYNPAKSAGMRAQQEHEVKMAQEQQAAAQQQKQAQQAAEAQKAAQANKPRNPKDKGEP